MIDTTQLITLGGWLLATILGIYEAWRKFSPQKQVDILEVIQEALLDGRITAVELIEIAQKIIEK